jgi:hypothetical protein
MTAALHHARQEWEQAGRRLDAAAAEDPRRGDELHRQVDAIGDELRRRVGSTFTLGELVEEYGRAERWARDVVGGLEPPSPGWPRTLELVQGAAFNAYARGAVDYEP